MEIKKLSNTFDVYRIECSYGELLSLRDALSKSHSGPVADDAYQGMIWHLEKLPKPGEEEEKKTEGGEDDAPGGPGGNHSLRSAADELKTPDETQSPSPADKQPEGKKKVSNLADLDDELPMPKD